MYDGSIGTYKAMLAYTGLKDMGIVTASNAEGGPDAKLDQIRELAANL